MSQMKNRYGLGLLQYSKFYKNLILIEDDIHCFKKSENFPPVLIYGVRYYDRK